MFKYLLRGGKRLDLFWITGDAFSLDVVWSEALPVWQGFVLLIGKIFLQAMVFLFSKYRSESFNFTKTNTIKHCLSAEKGFLLWKYRRNNMVNNHPPEMAKSLGVLNINSIKLLHM